MTQAAHLPVRQCVGCRERRPQTELVRLVKGASGWKPDQPGRRGKQPGRGVYLCSVECLPRVAKNKRYPGLAAAAAEYGLISSSKRMRDDVRL